MTRSSPHFTPIFIWLKTFPVVTGLPPTPPSTTYLPHINLYVSVSKPKSICIHILHIYEMLWQMSDILASWQDMSVRPCHRAGNLWILLSINQSNDIILFVLYLLKIDSLKIEKFLIFSSNVIELDINDNKAWFWYLLLSMLS